MKLNRIFGCVLGLVAFTAASGAPLTESERVRAEIMPSFNAMQAAANVHDADAHLAFIARDPDLISSPAIGGSSAGTHCWSSSANGGPAAE